MSDRTSDSAFLPHQSEHFKIPYNFCKQEPNFHPILSGIKTLWDFEVFAVLSHSRQGQSGSQISRAISDSSICLSTAQSGHSTRLGRLGQSRH
jgi:hypothetical protein